METVTVLRDQKPRFCGTMQPIRDDHGNSMVHAIRANNAEFKFYTKGAARLWLELGGLLGD